VIDDDLDDEHATDEDWYDDDDDVGQDESAPCPECGGTVQSISDNCPQCGYWLSDADRRAMWTGMAKPLWLRVTAAIVLLAFLLSLLAIGVVLFCTGKLPCRGSRSGAIIPACSVQLQSRSHLGPKVNNPGSPELRPSRGPETGSALAARHTDPRALARRSVAAPAS
jgi:hypothetical protein